MILILDNIRSGHNVGSILRTAEFFGVENVFLCGITPRFEHKEVKKTSLGAEKSLIIKKYHSTLRLVKKLKKENFTILALEQHVDSILINQFLSELRSDTNQHMSARRTDICWLEKAVLIVGNEINGVNKKILELADYILEIPKIGKEKESLNVSIATGIAIYELINFFLNNQ